MANRIRAFILLALVWSGASLAASRAAGAECIQIGPADRTAIDRAVVLLPALGSKQIDLKVGAMLPRSMPTKPVPPAVRKILPQFVGQRAFRSGMMIVVVDPTTRRLSYLLPLRGAIDRSKCPNGSAR